MSQANVEIYRRLSAALDAREVPEALLAPEFRMENIVTAVSDKTYRGVAGVREWISDSFDVLAEGTRLVAEETIADGDEFVVGRVALVGSGARSGAPLHLRWISVGWFSDGKATRCVGSLQLSLRSTRAHSNQRRS
jgi:ketosteroid isomerase-like protein